MAKKAKNKTFKKIMNLENYVIYNKATLSFVNV